MNQVINRGHPAAVEFLKVISGFKSLCSVWKRQTTDTLSGSGNCFILVFFTDPWPDNTCFGNSAGADAVFEGRGQPLNGPFFWIIDATKQWAHSIQWMSALMMPSTGKAFQRRGWRHSANRWSLKLEIFCAHPFPETQLPFPQSGKVVLVPVPAGRRFWNFFLAWFWTTPPPLHVLLQRKKCGVTFEACPAGTFYMPPHIPPPLCFTPPPLEGYFQGWVW